VGQSLRDSSLTNDAFEDCYEPGGELGSGPGKGAKQQKSAAKSKLRVRNRSLHMGFEEGGRKEKVISVHLGP